MTAKKDYTTGNLPKQVFWFWLPILAAGIISKLFSVADTAVLGQMADVTAVAAISTVTIIIHLTVDGLNGFSHGAIILISHALGKKDDEELQRLNRTGLMTAFLLGILILIFGLSCGNFIPAWVNCPEECYHGAVVYIKIYLAAAPAILIYNFCAAVIRAAGKPNTPTYIILISGVINLVLNIILCFVLEEKVAAVAIATLVSQVISALLSLQVMWKMGGVFVPNFNPKNFDPNACIKIVKIGCPCAFSTAIFSIGNLPMTRAINSFGMAQVAGNSAACQLGTVMDTFINSIAAVALNFVGQNYGAGKFNRVRKSIWHCVWMGSLAIESCGIICLIFYRPLLSVFLTGESAVVEEAIATGFARMIRLHPLYFIPCVGGIFSQTVQGLGYTAVPTGVNILSALIFRNLWVWFILPHYYCIESLFLCYVISWGFSFFLNTCALVFFTKKKGIWKKEPAKTFIST